jgi:hypothetical protein
MFVMTVTRTLLFCAAWLAPSVAHAYVGPGAGITAIGSLVVLIAAVLLAIFGFVWYPVKRLMKSRRKARAEAEKDGAAPS